MPKFGLWKRDINMGNEDEWNLVVSDDLSEAHIEHWWSHRKSGRNIDFETDSRDIPLGEIKTSDPGLYKKAKGKLAEIGFKGEVP